MAQSNRAEASGGGGSTGGRNGSSNNKFRKGDRTRRMWTEREEQILASSLQELVARGWKADNGFRTGYLRKIEDDIRAEFPKSDLKGTPHVTSKITVWKKNYNSLRDILGRSGVGFNTDGDHKIDIDDDQWAQVLAADKDAKGMRNKSWPLWESWKCIFGKDRASGAGSENVDVAATLLRAQMGSGSHCNENDYHPSFEDFLPGDVPHNMPPVVEQCTNSEAQSVQHVSTTKSGSNKRKHSSSDDALMEFLGKLHDKTDSRLDIIASRIGYEFDMGKARQEVFDKLEEVDGLTLDQQYELCDILADKPQRLEVFIGMRANKKLGYLQRLIANNRAPY